MNTLMQIDPAALEPERALGLFQAIMSAVGQKNWALLAGLMITLVVAGARWLGLTKKLSKSYDKWVAAGLAGLQTLAIGLQLGMGMKEMLMMTVSAAVAAVGGWEYLLKPLLAKLLPKSDG
jgi:uncharacterized membrane protein YqgA involved in biofilm formation